MLGEGKSFSLSGLDGKLLKSTVQPSPSLYLLQGILIYEGWVNDSKPEEREQNSHLSPKLMLHLYMHDLM